MNNALRNKIFNHLNLSKDKVLDEIALLSAHQKVSELEMETEYFRNKYKESYESFNSKIEEMQATYEIENDWLAWKFAKEGIEYWKSLLDETNK